MLTPFWKSDANSNHNDANPSHRGAFDAARQKTRSGDEIRPEINRPLSDNAQNFLKKELPDHISNSDRIRIIADGKGRFGVQQRGDNGEFGKEFIHTIDLKDLPPNAKIYLRYQEKKVAFVKKFGEDLKNQRINIDVNNIHNLQEVNGEYQFQYQVNGEFRTHTMKPKTDQIREIDQHLSEIGLANDKQYISPDTVGRAVREKIIEREIKKVNPNASKEEIDGAINTPSYKSMDVYAYHKGDKKENNPYVFHVIEKENINGHDEQKAFEFNQQEYNEIFKNAERYAIEKHLKLPEGKSIAEDGIALSEGKYRIKDTGEGTYSIPEADIKNELNIEPRRAEPDILPTKTVVDLEVPNNDTVKSLEEQKAKYEKRCKRLMRVLEVSKFANDGILQYGQGVAAAFSELMQFHENTNMYQQTSQLTHSIVASKHKKIDRHTEMMEAQIKSEKEAMRLNTAKSAAGGNVEAVHKYMDDERKRNNKEKNGKKVNENNELEDD